jgi:hypothetical protein
MRYIAAAVIASIVLLVGCVQERTGVTRNELPGPVLATLEKNARPGVIKSIVKERSEKNVTYKAVVTDDARTWDIAINGDGDLVYKKER